MKCYDVKTIIQSGLYDINRDLENDDVNVAFDKVKMLVFKIENMKGQHQVRLRW